MAKSIAQIYDIRQKLFWGLFTLLSALFILYAFLLNNTIISVVFVEEHQREVVAMHSSFSKLEQEYLSKTGGVTIDRAYAAGFVDDSTPSYIETLSLRAEVSLENSSQ